MRIFDDHEHANMPVTGEKEQSEDDGFWDEVGDFTAIDQATLHASVNRKKRSDGTS